MKISYKPMPVQEHHAGEVELSGVRIGEAVTGMIISNTFADWVKITFGCGFEISIGYRGILITRDRHRPNHDHDDTEYLCFEKETNKLEWRTDQEMGKNYETLMIPFGSVTVDG